MKITLPKNETEGRETLEVITNLVSSSYAFNLRAEVAQKSARRFNVVLRVKDSKLAPARKSASGRRTIGASWQAHREWLEQLFIAFPSARVETALATYRGKDDFVAKFNATYHKNAGSMMTPVSFGSL